MPYKDRMIQVIEIIKKQKHIRLFLGLSLWLILIGASSQKIALIILFSLPIYLAIKRYEIIHRKYFTLHSALAMNDKRAFFDFYYLLTAFVPFVIYITNLFIMQQNINNVFIIVASFFSIILLLEFILVFMVRIIITDKETNDQESPYGVIISTICIYMLVGLLCTFMYLIVFLLDEKAFYNGNFKNVEVPFDLLYFSFKTLTTVGYGDIVPVSFAAKIITNFEAIIGVMFPAVFIARLVGNLNSK